MYGKADILAVDQPCHYLKVVFTYLSVYGTKSALHHNRS